MVIQKAFASKNSKEFCQGGIVYLLGWGFKLKNGESIIVIPKFDVPMYIKMESTFPRKFWGDLLRGRPLIYL